LSSKRKKEHRRKGRTALLSLGLGTWPTKESDAAFINPRFSKPVKVGQGWSWIVILN
jgi:hypothetical protein